MNCDNRRLDESFGKDRRSDVIDRTSLVMAMTTRAPAGILNVALRLHTNYVVSFLGTVWNSLFDY
jgi:hypothetical protein